MVQNVGENDLELRAHTLRDFDFFLNAHIHVPVGQSGENTPASVSSIQAKNRVAEVVVHRFWIREDIHGQTTVAEARGACGAVDRVPSPVWRDGHGILGVSIR